MAVEVRRLTRDETAAAFDDLARLRITVFRDWPYLYDGDLAYERRYLGNFLAAPQAVVIGALDGDRLVGAATASPLTVHHPEFAEPVRAAGMDPAGIFYFGESVLLADRRGQGIGVRFFEEREAAARELGFVTCLFSAVVRPETHPLRPEGHVSLNGFWRNRGYERVADLVTTFSWKDIGEKSETPKPMEYWRKSLF
ncbi:MAG: GNAT family N-acetyltransferase [Notoacmeibacter sp.]|nr:GNAT family N-acetyltransferase [Notoacmeibacter sp.]